ncbi:MAG: phosphoribosyltransferase [Parcubacteria group bacterium Gr01-1014_48]|nr:MAG: phosphoribosyltransferase [Parcubacteria group bacterium Greene0416_14]TSC71692.1 MAG: phosphoribosyltransferase [Parcubacteria group bacterium Gr01-1014_48]TSD01091.1 MAG: phosphoribosyltransferase [Parcubacteria group bacterium Greene1014_15]TSD07961.1 MAG: phosphoribosyltransferase [Parcubacteria group bacterium Greene0714_4]
MMSIAYHRPVYSVAILCSIACIMLKKIIRSILDVIYPPRKAERSWRNKTAEELTAFLPAAPAHLHTNIYALFDYKNAIVRDIIWSLKYDGSPEAANLCAKLLYDIIVAEVAEQALFLTMEKPLLIPIPLSRKREQERGFNQCVRITNELEKLDNNRCFALCKNILIKQRDTPSQTKSQNKQERAENLRGCFNIPNPDDVRNKDIIIVDDVMTTGSTLAEATATLKRAGARKILCFTFAH